MMNVTRLVAATAKKAARPSYDQAHSDDWKVIGKEDQRLAGILVCECSPTESWAFPRSQLLKYQFNPNNQLLELEFPLHLVKAKMPTGPLPGESAGKLALEIVSGIYSVLVSREHQIPTPKLNEPNGAFAVVESLVCDEKKLDF